MGEPMNSLAKKNKKVKYESNEAEEELKEEDPNAVSNFRISTPLREALKTKGIVSLFPIQAMTLDMILDGSDLVGRARTGQDHIERGNIDFRALKFRVLDKADEMLRMGFVEDVELILGKVADASKVQTLLFSATLPDWVKQVLCFGFPELFSSFLRNKSH